VRRLADLAPPGHRQALAIGASFKEGLVASPAAKSAQPTPGAADLVGTARSAGLTVTVVSNNSADAISLYCLDHGVGP
jgi:predicted HAD superfamily phosphohydrolase YqeG